MLQSSHDQFGGCKVHTSLQKEPFLAEEGFRKSMCCGGLEGPAEFPSGSRGALGPSLQPQCGAQRGTPERSPGAQSSPHGDHSNTG